MSAETDKRPDKSQTHEPAKGGLKPPPTSMLPKVRFFSLKLCGDVVERSAQTSPDRRHRDHRSYCDEGGNEAVFDRGCTAIISQQFRNALKH